MLAPVVGDGQRGWRIARTAAPTLALARIEVDSPSALALPPAAGPEAPTHYLAMLRYDHPEGRPGSTFSTSFELAAPRGHSLVPPLAGLHEAGLEEVEAAFQDLRQRLGEQFQRHLISARLVGAPPAKRAAAGDPSFSCVFASCQYPAGMMDRLPANASYRAMGRWFARRPQEMERLDKVLLLGDQVYTDATYGLLDPVRLDDRYRIPYEDLTSASGPLAQLPLDFHPLLMCTPDDHELVNDWEPWRDGVTGERHKRGVAAYWAHQRHEERKPPHIWQMDHGPGWHLFMADTRTTREHRSEETLDTATILGQAQTLALEHWLYGHRGDDLKIVTSPAMLLPRTRRYIDDPLYLEGWSGYPASFQRLLAWICDKELHNLVFLSGDTHLAVDATVTVQKEGAAPVTFSSFHAPSLYAPFPFANESRWNLVCDDDFSFRYRHPSAGEESTYRCTVKARFPAGLANGFGLLRASRQGGAWDVRMKVVGSKKAAPS